VLCEYPTPMRPIARLRTELLASGLGQMLVGAFGLAIAFLDGADARDALVPFAAFAAALALFQLFSGFRFVQQGAAEAGAPAGDVTVERPTDTVRRTAVSLGLPTIAVVLVGLVDGELTAWVAGVPFGVGVVDVATAGWVGRREKTTEERLYRELGRSPFASGRRRIYTVPRSAMTLDT
jgi:hypothetical protein